MANLDTAVKRESGLHFPSASLPLPDVAAEAEMDRATLVGRYGAFTFLVASITFLAVAAPDETATGAICTVYAQFIDDIGTTHAFDAAPRIRLWRVTAAGAVADVSAGTMTQVGSTNTWSYDWTPTVSASYTAFVFGTFSSANSERSFNVSVRPKFDPVGLALDDVLVARM